MQQNDRLFTVLVIATGIAATGLFVIAVLWPEPFTRRGAVFRHRPAGVNHSESSSRRWFRGPARRTTPRRRHSVSSQNFRDRLFARAEPGRRQIMSCSQGREPFFFGGCSPHRLGSSGSWSRRAPFLEQLAPHNCLSFLRMD
jgi:hypothetical protein